MATFYSADTRFFRWAAVFEGKDGGVQRCLSAALFYFFFLVFDWEEVNEGFVLGLLLCTYVEWFTAPVMNLFFTFYDLLDLDLFLWLVARDVVIQYGEQLLERSNMEKIPNHW